MTYVSADPRSPVCFKIPDALNPNRGENFVDAMLTLRSTVRSLRDTLRHTDQIMGSGPFLCGLQHSLSIGCSSSSLLAHEFICIEDKRLSEATQRLDQVENQQCHEIEQQMGGPRKRVTFIQEPTSTPPIQPFLDIGELPAGESGYA